MMNFKKSKVTRVASGFVGLATAVLMIGPAVASAATVEELTAQINALLAQVAALQAQTGSVATVSTPAAYTFSKDLTMGSKGADVTALQQVLVAKGFLTMPAGVAMGHFGSLTKAAVAAWQASAGISPAAGYVGPKSRAALNATGVATGGTTGGTAGGFPGTTGGTTGTTGGTTGSTAGVVAGAVTASLLPNTGSTIVAGAAQIAVLNFRLANGTNADVMVTGMKFTKNGVLSDSNISNAYISVGNTVVAQYTGLTNGVVSFGGNLFSLPAGKSLDLSFRVDVSTGASVGNTVSFALMSASDVTLSAGALSGTFPMVGGSQTVSQVTNPSLASISNLAYQAVASQVDAGTNAFRGGAVSFTVNNNPVKVQSMAFTVSGSLNFATDLQNMTLRIDGVEAAKSTGVATDGKAHFDLGDKPYQIGTGSHQIEVYTDVVGTANRVFKMEILRPYDVLIWDTAYNTNISFGTPSGSATNVSVRQGTGTVSLSSNTPTGTVPRGGSQLTIAKYTIRASGEALRIKWLPFKITQGGSAAAWSTVANVDSDIRNIAIYADDGTQIGTTINTPSGCSYGTPEVTATTYICSFGSPSSIVNYLIPANTTKVFSLVVDVQSGGDVTSLKGALVAPSGTSGFQGNNAEGQISFQTSSIPGGEIAGSSLAVSASPFLGSQNSAFSSQTFVGGANVAKIASFALSASAGEAINITSMTVQTSSNVNAGFNIQNLTAKVGDSVWNYNIPTLTAGTAYTFSSPNGQTTIPAGGTVNIDVYADVLTGSTPATYTAPLSLVGAVGIGAQTNTNQTLKNTAGTVISTSAAVAGQNITVAGVGTLVATVNSSLPPSQQIVLGSTNVSLGQFRFTSGNNEDMKVVDLILTASSTSASAPATFKNVVLKDVAGTVLGTGTSLAGSLGVYRTSFHFATPLLIQKNITNEYKVAGDVSTFTESPSSQNTAYVWSIGTSSDINAFGNASNQSVVVSTSSPLIANQQTVLRTKLTAAMTTLGATLNRARTATDDIANLTMNVDQAYGAEFKGVTLKLSGAAVPSTGNITVSLVDNDTGVTATSSTVAVGVATSTGVPLTLTTPFLITQGLQKIYKVRVDSSGFTNASNTSDSFSLQIVNGADLSWQTQGLTESLGLETKVVPITSTVSYE